MGFLSTRASVMDVIIFPMASLWHVFNCENMSVKIESRRKNPLLKREEAWIVIEHEGKATPKRADIIGEAAKAMKADKELLIIDKIFSREGKAASAARVLVYEKSDLIPAAKAEKMKRRLGLAKKEGAEAAPAEPAK